MNTVTVNGVDLEFNLLDADVMEKYHAANEKLVKIISDKTKYKGLSTTDSMRLLCRHINEFFDDLFGAGIAEKLFGANNDLGIRMDGFGAVSIYAAETTQRLDDINKKYTASVQAKSNVVPLASSHHGKGKRKHSGNSQH